MDKEVRKFKEAHALICEQGFKHVKLLDLEGGVLVPGNAPKTPIGPKLKEIEKRLAKLPDGIYCLQAQDNYGVHYKPYKYYVGKGKYNPADLSEEDDAPKKNGKKLVEKNGDHVLSYEAALKHIEDKKELEKQNELLKMQLAELTQKVANLESGELDEEEDEEENFTDAAGGWLKEIIPSVIPVLDRHYDLEEKKLKFRTAKYMAENGLLPQQNGRSYKIAGKQPKEEKREVPEVGSEEWGDFIAWIQQLEETDFNNFMAQLKVADTATYEAVCKEVYEDGESEEEEEEQED